MLTAQIVLTKNIKIPAEEEFKNQKRVDRRNFIAGLVKGLIFFTLVGTRVFWYGLETVELYTWIALGFGVISFSFLARLFGREFWQRLFGGL